MGIKVKNIDHPLFKTYENMHERCELKSRRGYEKYAEKGIKVCGRWSGKGGFKHFVEDMGDKPSDGYSIDRVNNTRGYEPSNCKWATAKEQANNRSNNIVVKWNGEDMTFSNFLTANGLHSRYATCYGRHRRGWSPQKILNKELSKGGIYE